MMSEQEIRDWMDANDVYSAYVRIDPIVYNVGDTLPASRVWDDGEPTEETLDGTCCLQLSAMDKISRYKGCVYLVSGESLYEGNDVGETVVADAIVLLELNRC